MHSLSLQVDATTLLPCFRTVLAPLRSQLLFNLVFVVLHNAIIDNRPSSR